MSPSVHTGSDQGTDQVSTGRDGSPEARLSTRHLTSKQPTEVDILTRGLVAIAWAAVFVAVSDSVTSGVTVGGGVPVVLYPLIDVGASDRRAGPARIRSAAPSDADLNSARAAELSHIWLADDGLSLCASNGSAGLDCEGSP